MGSKSTIAIVILVAISAIYALFRETYWAVAVDFAFEHVAKLLNVEKSAVIAASSPVFVLFAAFSLVALISYRLGERDRNKEPTPDIDPRRVFEKIIDDKRWRQKYTEYDAEKLQHLFSNYLNMRLADQIHAALAQGRLLAWGAKLLPRGEGPIDRLSASIWQDVEIVFGPSTDGARAYTASRRKGGVAYVGIKMNAAQVAKEFSIKRRLLQ